MRRTGTLADADRACGSFGGPVPRADSRCVSRSWSRESSRRIAFGTANRFQYDETGGMRRVWVRGHENVRKRVLIQAAACNIGLLLRRLTGVGTPRSLQGRAVSAICRLIGRLIMARTARRASARPLSRPARSTL